VAKCTIETRAVATQKISTRLLAEPVRVVTTLKVIVSKWTSVAFAATANFLDESAHMGAIAARVRATAVRFHRVVVEALGVVAAGVTFRSCRAGIYLEQGGKIVGRVHESARALCVVMTSGIARVGRNKRERRAAG